MKQKGLKLHTVFMKRHNKIIKFQRSNLSQVHPQITPIVIEAFQQEGHELP